MTKAEQSYTILDRIPTDEDEDARLFAEEILVGLSESPKRLGSKYFYDDTGSRLFQQICTLDEYYPTRIERDILRSSAADILGPVAEHPLNIVDLGAGDGHKTAALLEWLLERGADVRYVPIDISEGAMKEALSILGAQLPNLVIEGIVSDYFEGLSWLARQTERMNFVLFLGSNIGNFDKPRARAFLRRLWNALNPNDRALVGFDLKKDIEALLRAYNDRAGVTARFNLNLLERINRELGADFDLDKWRHYGTYNVFTGAMESYLVSLEAQTVRIDAVAHAFHFAPWEPIFTEYSYKYLESDIDALAESAHFVTERKFHDPKGWFCDAVWKVEKL
ncbi:MAG: L-histidine N(alpha)-methyltransferase [Myxococcota bacterium]